MKTGRLLVIEAVVVAAGLCLASGARAQQTLYTACNIWYENPERIASINYKQGVILPAGTAVRDVVATVGEKEVLRGKKVIHFRTVSDGRAFTISFNPEHYPNLTVEQYRDRVFTLRNFEELTRGLNPRELESIKMGELKVGLSKRAVLIAWGQPPAHATPSQEGNKWTYWRSRFRKKVIYFDRNGLTTRSPQEDADIL